jgi:hypothetical protein
VLAILLKPYLARSTANTRAWSKPTVKLAHTENAGTRADQLQHHAPCRQSPARLVRCFLAGWHARRAVAASREPFLRPARLRLERHDELPRFYKSLRDANRVRKARCTEHADDYGARAQLGFSGMTPVSSSKMFAVLPVVSGEWVVDRIYGDICRLFGRLVCYGRSNVLVRRRRQHLSHFERIFLLWHHHKLLR